MNSIPSLHGRTSNIRFNVAMARDHRRSFIMYVLIPATDFYDCTILCCATKCPRHCLLSMAYEILKVL